MEIDIRKKGKLGEINSIRFYESSDSLPFADIIVKEDDDSVYIKDSDQWDVDLMIENKGHAEYLIEALKKAIELGWFE